jgi:hypothetical protein
MRSKMEEYDVEPSVSFIKKRRHFSEEVLRGDNLREKAIAALDDMVNVPWLAAPISVTALAARLGVSRRALYNNDLAATVAEYIKQQ